MTYTCKWGIMATGGISTTFTKDLLEDPAKRNVDDVKHQVAAVASSSSKERAEQFVKDVGAPESTAAYGNYQDLVSDKNVDIIYVGTPHGLHYRDAKLALEAGKHVLCEKAFTINEKQAKELIRIAKEKKLFLMEAVWTRFFPLTKKLQKMLFEDKVIGDLMHVDSCNSLPFAADLPLTHRMLNPELGGGALLDLGIYSLTWTFMIGYHDPNNKNQEPLVRSLMTKNKETGVDESTVMALVFPESQVTCTATTSMRIKDWGDVCTIKGSKGHVTVSWSPFRPQSFTVHIPDENAAFDDYAAGKVKYNSTKYDAEFPGHGMFYEADECARCLRDGKTESETMGLEESRVMMAVMDKVRHDNDFYYPDNVEACN